jgi:hypothetical protein
MALSPFVKAIGASTTAAAAAALMERVATGILPVELSFHQPSRMERRTRREVKCQPCECGFIQMYLRFSLNIINAIGPFVCARETYRRRFGSVFFKPLPRFLLISLLRFVRRRNSPHDQIDTTRHTIHCEREICSAWWQYISTLLSKINDHGLTP